MITKSIHFDEFAMRFSEKRTLYALSFGRSDIPRHRTPRKLATSTRTSCFIESLPNTKWDCCLLPTSNKRDTRILTKTHAGLGSRWITRVGTQRRSDPIFIIGSRIQIRASLFYQKKHGYGLSPRKYTRRMWKKIAFGGV